MTSQDPKLPVSIFKTISQTDFLHHYWQNKPFIFASPFLKLKNIVSGDELAGFACEEGVESRIIRGHTMNGDWQCQQGPFEEKYFTTLPEQNWTLLVQGVDQWDDEIRAILERFNFLPKWRLEDIMASYAPVGGGVGPHFDYYDVFLIQLSGRREWQIGQRCDNRSALQNNSQVKLLTEFECKETHSLSAGDMIYIPAGIAHWGTSLSDDCITLSVGFRAPSENEILIEALEGLIEHFSRGDPSDSQRYQDTLASIDEHPNKINQPVLTQLKKLREKLTPDLVEKAIDQAFGQLVTDPRYSPFDDEEVRVWSESELFALFEDDATIPLNHSTNSRFAFSETLLFVNGDAYSAEERFSRSICDKAISKPQSKEQIAILLTLLNQGYIGIKK